MRKLKSLMAVMAIAILAGCQKDIKKENEISATSNPSVANPSSLVTTDLDAKLRQLCATFPTNKQKSDLIATLNAAPNTEYENEVLKALKVIEPTACDRNTPLIVWFKNQFNDWTDYTYFVTDESGITIYPLFYALYFQNSSANQYFGLNGAYTQSITKTFKDLKRFWTINTNDMVVVGMHGNMLLDHDKVMMVEKFLFPWETY